MSRYDTPGGDGSEFEPGSRGLVLRNLLGITEPAEMERVETELLTVAYLDSFERVTMGTRFTAEMIRDMHRQWLGHLYPWAGHYRAVNVSKGNFLFCAADYIEPQMLRLEQEQLAEHTPCSGSVEDVANRVAIVHAELLLIHPFREGNGRLGRWLADLMVLQAGFPVPEYDLDNDPKRQRYYAAMMAGFKGDVKPLAALFESWIARGQSLSGELRTP